MKLTKIHEDKRGYTHTVEDDNLFYPEISLFFTRRGFARGGCVHGKHDEFFCVVAGVVTFVCGNSVSHLSDGMCVVIPRGTPHYFRSNTDSIVLEWGVGKEEKKVKNLEYRNIVQQINDTADRT